MPINFGNPTTTQLRTNYATSLQDHQKALAQWLDDAVAGTLTSTPTGAFRVRSADNGAVQRWNGSSFVAQPINGINYSGGNGSFGISAPGTGTKFQVQGQIRAAENSGGSLLLEDADLADASTPFWRLISDGGSLNVFSANRSGTGTTGSVSRLSMTTTLASFNVKVNSPAFEMNGTGGAPSTGIAAPASSTLATYCNTIEVERILPSGRHLFGTASDAGPYRLQVVSDASTAWMRLKAGAAAASYLDFQRGDTGATLGYLGSDGGAAVTGGTGSNLALRAEGSLYLAAGGNNIRMQFNATGQTGINCTPVAGASLRIQAAGNNDVGLEWQRASATAANLASYNRQSAAWTDLSYQALEHSWACNAVITHKLLSTGHWQPQGTTETLDLGDSTHRYRKLWIKDIDLSGDLSGKGAATTYTPVLTAGANISGTPTVTSAWYFRQNDLVEGYVVVSVAFTAADTTSTLGIALPVVSNLGSTHDLVGDCWTLSLLVADNHKVSGFVSADTANDRATATFSPTTTTGHTWIFRFSYRILP
jgi:hypothetical protein